MTTSEADRWRLVECCTSATLPTGPVIGALRALPLSFAGRRSRTTPGSGPEDSARSSIFSTPPCESSVTRDTTAAASTGSPSSVDAHGCPSTSTSPARKTSSGISPGKWPAS